MATHSSLFLLSSLAAKVGLPLYVLTSQSIGYAQTGTLGSSSILILAGVVAGLIYVHLAEIGWHVQARLAPCYDYARRRR